MSRFVPVFYINSRIFTPFFTKMRSKRGQKNFPMGSDLFDNNVNNCKSGPYKNYKKTYDIVCYVVSLLFFEKNHDQQARTLRRSRLFLFDSYGLLRTLCFHNPTHNSQSRGAKHHFLLIMGRVKYCCRHLRASTQCGRSVDT